MNLKSFSFGLGLGVVFVSALSLVLMKGEVSKIRKENEASESVEITDEEIIARAKDLGMISLSALPSRKEAVSEDLSSTGVEDAAEITTERESPEDESADEKLIDEDSETSQINEGTSVYIKPGSTAHAISNEFQKKGIIDDADEFRLYLVENGYSTKISSGSFEIPKDADYDEIFEIIRDKKR